MASSHVKTTFVKPLCESNDFGNIHQSFISSVYPYKKAEDFIGNHCKQHEANKIPDKDKRKHILKMDSVYSKLLVEFEEIQKWKALIEIKDKQKNKKIEELHHTIETQRKTVLDLQLQNENLILQLTEEVQQRNFVSEKLHSTKEMCSALKKHFNTLQGHFEYRNQVDDMIDAADNKKIKEIEDMRNKIDKISIEHSEKVEYLNNALASETNKSLDLREKFEQQLIAVENERETLCTMVRNYEKKIGHLSALLDEEKNNTQTLEREKKELETNIFQLENSKDYYQTLLKEKEETLKIIELSKQDIEKQFLCENSRVKEWEMKYKELLHICEVNKSELGEKISTLKMTNEQLNNKVFELETKFLEEENKNRELTYLFQDIEKKKCDLELKVTEEESKLSACENLKSYLKELENSYSLVKKEKDDIAARLEALSEDLNNCRSEKDLINNQCVEEAEKFLKCKMEYEKKLAVQTDKLSCAENNYELLLTKLKNTEESFEKSLKLISEKDNKLKNLELLIEEHKKIEGILQNENSEKKEEIEEKKPKECIKCEELKEKVLEIESLKADLLKKEEDISSQSKGIDDLLKLLENLEANYNKNRLTKQSEILSYQNQVKSLEHELKMVKFEQKELTSLKLENEKLSANVKELNVKISANMVKERELQEKLKEMGLENDRMKKFETKLKVKKRELRKESQVKNVKFKRLDLPESEANDSNLKISNTPSKSGKKSTASEYIKIENLHKAKRICDDPNNKKWDLDSSGSECLELIFDKKSEKAVGLAKVTPKSDLKKNTSTPVSENKFFPFVTKRKKDNQIFSQEDIVRKKFGLPPRKKQNAFQDFITLEEPLKTPKNMMSSVEENV